MHVDWITGPFIAPVHGLATTRAGGVSDAPFDRMNLGAACGDRPEHVAENRARLGAVLPSRPRWLRQVHSGTVVHLDDWYEGVEADAAWTDRTDQVVAVLAADCVPILLADTDGRCVAAAHAGWRGLVAGIIENTVAALPVQSSSLHAWIGPSIRQDRYEVGSDVREAFDRDDDSRAFQPTRSGHWQMDLQAIAVGQLSRAGVGEITDSRLCTAADPTRFFSHRRDGRSGRQACIAWIDSSPAFPN